MTVPYSCVYFSFFVISRWQKFCFFFVSSNLRVNLLLLFFRAFVLNEFFYEREHSVVEQLSSVSIVVYNFLFPYCNLLLPNEPCIYFQFSFVNIFNLTEEILYLPKRLSHKRIAHWNVFNWRALENLKVSRSKHEVSLLINYVEHIDKLLNWFV